MTFPLLRRRRLSLMTCLFLIMTSAWGTDATGFARTENCELLRGVHLYLTDFQKGWFGIVMVELPEVADYGAEWMDVPATFCSGPSKCTHAKQAKIRIRKTKRHLTGEYKFEFEDGEQGQGSFEAVWRPRPKTFICE
jgi:hypothetical protein